MEMFHQQLSQYEMHELRILYEYFKDDLIYIVESLHTHSFLSELKSRTTLDVQQCLTLKHDLGASAFAEKLVKYILEAGREALIGFWETLYVLQNDHPHPNLLAVLNEIIERGHALKQQILLDEHGHSMTPQITDIQGHHKQHLLDETQNLVEYRAPGCTLQPQSFYISERFVDLIVISTVNFRDRSQHELIETGVKHEDYLQNTRNGLERVAHNRPFRWCHQSKSIPRKVMVSGVPGIGKTMLMQKFVCDWVNGKIYQRFAFVFFFKFRELNSLGEVSLETMILQQYPYLETQLGEITQEPEKLLFIFDGLDESVHQMDFRSNYLCTNVKQKENLGVIVVSLLKECLLEGCSVLMTSRPTKLATTDTSVFQRVCEIMGFFHKEREIYFEHFFRNKELSDKAFHYVRENDILYTFCYIPSYCWIICTVLSMCFKIQPTDTDQMMLLLPKTVTQLFVTYVSNILSNHCQDKGHAQELLTSIGWMAEHGVRNHTIIFEEQDLRSFNVDTSSHLLSSFMMVYNQTPNVNLSFLHLTVQEFIAALVHYVNYSPDKLQDSLDKSKSFHDGRAEIFLRFLCGLSDHSSRSLLKPFLNFSTEASKDVINWIHQLIPIVQKSPKNYRERRESLNVLTYLFESRNKTLVSEFLGQNSTFDFSRFSLAPLDCTVLAFILSSCRETNCLDLEKCYIQSEGWERLSPALHTIQDLRLSSNGLRDSGITFISSALSHPECRIQNLSLEHNELTDSCCSQLASAVSNNQSLRKVDLSFNNLAGPHFSDLMTALSNPTCRIESLVLCQAKLMPECSKYLASLSNNTNLTYLNVSHNYITNSGSSHIIDLIQRSSSLKEFRVGANGFSKEVNRTLKQLENNRPNLKSEAW